MNITVLYFGALREAAGWPSETLELSANSTAQQVLDHASEKLPAMQGLLQRSAVAINQSYAMPSTQLHDGDEVALLPPVSGGLGSIV